MSDTGTSERVVLVLLRFMYILIIHFCICIFSAFVPLNELINSLSPEMLCKWERLWMVSDRREGVVHPLVYPHPVTGLKVRIHIIIINLYKHMFKVTSKQFQLTWTKGSPSEVLSLFCISDVMVSVVYLHQH